MSVENENSWNKKIILKARLNGFNIFPTFVQQKLKGCWVKNVGWTVEMVSTPFSIFKNKGNVEAMLNGFLNQFNFDSTYFQQAFNIFHTFNNVEQPIQMTPTFGSRKC